ncbi:hypothetical protein FRC07_006982 [Ceratobasidium sp. 392]|nr:hypothetical protein FRC07_006982 [Ceratobasidium sp. 392]
MSDPSSFNVLVWDSKHPNRPTRSRQTQRSQIMDIPRLSQQNLSSTSSTSSNSYTTAMEASANPSPQPNTMHELAQFSTCEISDQLVKLGLTHNATENPVQRGGFIPDINMMSPSPNDMAGQNTKICGFAYTVKMVRGDDLYAPKPAQHFVDAAPPGSVAVISVPPNIKSAAWGGLMTAGAQVRGVRGVVIDGRARDLVEHRAAGFAVFARGGSTLGQSPFTRPSELNVPITILPRPDFETCYENTFAAVEIHPGDYIVADVDGVVCVPPEFVENVVDGCRYSKAVDEKCMMDIQSGRSIQETFQHWRKSSKKYLLNQRFQDRLPGCLLPSNCKRQYSPPAAALAKEAPRRSPEATVSPRVTARNILKSVLELVPRTLSFELQQIWDQRARSAFDDLESGKSRPTRIAIWGDELSGAPEIVTSLLDDPLSNDLDQRNMIHERWRLDVPLDGTIQISDHVIIVTDNIRLLSAPGLPELLQDLSHAPSVHVLVAERAPSIPYSLKTLGGINPIIVKPDHAIQGLNAFIKGDINRYQMLLMESKIPQLAQQISRRCSESNVPSSPSSSASISVVRTAANTARSTLAACENAIAEAQNSLHSVASPLASFKTEVAAVYPIAYQSTLRGTVTVREGVAVVEQRIRSAFARLPWYSLWWRADEVSGTLGSEAVSWGPLGTQLAFHAGQLSRIRQQLYLRAVALAAASPVLSNKLAQIDSRTPIGPDALSTPLTQRTLQLLAPGGPVEDVHRKAQEAVMTTATAILGSGAIAGGLFLAGSASAGTAVGLGLFGSVVSVRWMQSVWARAEKRWWADWARVCAGLERDCEVTLKEVVRERVTGSAAAGVEGMESIIARRAGLISALKTEVASLKQQLVALEQRLK